MRRAVLLFASCLLALGLAEGVVRALGAAPEVGSLERGRFRLSDNPTLVYEPIPALDYAGSDLEFHVHRGRSNSLGFRDREHAPIKEPGTYRIAIVGDSIAAGFGIAEFEQTFPYLLEVLLRERGIAAEVLSFGVSGYNSEQQVESLSVNGLRFAPDLVLVAYCLNDHGPPEEHIVRGLREEAAGRVPVRPGSERWLRQSALYRLARFGVFDSGPSLDRLLPLTTDESERWSYARMEGAFERLSRMSDEHGFDVLFDVFPVFEASVNPTSLEHRQVVSRQSARLGFRHLDLQAAFNDCWRRDGEPLGQDVLHPTAAGHRCAAEASAGFIAAAGFFRFS